MKFHPRLAIAAAASCAGAAILAYVLSGGGSVAPSTSPVEPAPAPPLVASAPTADDAQQDDVETRVSGDILDVRGSLRRPGVAESVPTGSVVIPRGQAAGAPRKRLAVHLKGEAPPPAPVLLTPDPASSAATPATPDRSPAPTGAVPERAPEVFKPAPTGVDRAKTRTRRARTDTDPTGASLSDNSRDNLLADQPSGLIGQDFAAAQRSQRQTQTGAPPSGNLPDPADAQPPRRPYPSGNLTPEMELLRTQIGWHAFAKLAHEEAVGPAPPEIEAASK